MGVSIKNIQTFGLEDSFKASKYSFAVNTDDVNSEITDKIKSLAKCKMGTGHDNFLNGIIVQFDLTFSIKAWVEMQRYHFIDFVSSQSTMHCISRMDIKPMCNKYVSDVVIAEVERLKEVYLNDYLLVVYLGQLLERGELEIKVSPSRIDYLLKLLKIGKENKNE